MPGIIDFHAHAFPDQVAASAIPYLEEEGDVKANHDGRISSLLAIMDREGVDKSVICCIATRPSQFEAIVSWSKQISSDRIIPFPSFHPDDPQAVEHISQIKEEGFKGIKMHPYYQQFFLDDEKLYPAYEKIRELGLILVMHTGFDIAFPRIRRCDPRQILNVSRNSRWLPPISVPGSNGLKLRTFWPAEKSTWIFPTPWVRLIHRPPAGLSSSIPGSIFCLVLIHPGQGRKKPINNCRH